MKRKHIHYGLSWVAGFYYQENRTYYQNNHCRGGKLVLMMLAGIQYARGQENEV